MIHGAIVTLCLLTYSEGSDLLASYLMKDFYQDADGVWKIPNEVAGAPDLGCYNWIDYRTATADNPSNVDVQNHASMIPFMETATINGVENVPTLRFDRSQICVNDAGWGMPGGNSDRTIMGWVKWKSDSWGGIFGYGSPLKQMYQLDISWGNTNQLQLRLKTKTACVFEDQCDGTVTDNSDGLSRNGIWYHLAATYNNATRTNSVYVNGVLKHSAVVGQSEVLQTTVGDATGSDPNWMTPGGFIWIGASSFDSCHMPHRACTYGRNFFSGEIAQFQIYGKALTAGEVQGIQAQAAAPVPTTTGTSTTATTTTSATTTTTQMVFVDAAYCPGNVQVWVLLAALATAIIF